MTISVPGSSPSKCSQLADDCLQRAITASSVDLADQWLRIAGTWLAMEKFKRRRSTHAAELAALCDADSKKMPSPDGGNPM